PSQPVRAMGAERVVAINLKTSWGTREGPRHIFDVIGQCFSIAQKLNCASSRDCADLVIEPDVTGYRYDDFEHSAELVSIGEKAIRDVLPEIRQLMEIADQKSTDQKKAGLALASQALNPIAPE